MLTNDMALLRLLQLTTPALPIGAYAYSQGLEQAVERGWIHNETSAENWIGGLLHHTLCYLDVPIFARLHEAWTNRNRAAVVHWNHWLFASREAAELQREDLHLGTALARLLTDLGLAEAESWRTAPRVCFATLFSLATVSRNIPVQPATLGYLWTWTENQVNVAIKLIPLGQTQGQRLLSRLLPEIAAIVQRGLAISDDDIGCTAPGLGLASAWHETQYSRLFRS